MQKIGILTWHYYSNYGSALQAFALETLLKQHGFKSEIINYRNLKYGKEPRFKSFVKVSLSKLLYGYKKRKFAYPFLTFQKCNLNETRSYYNAEQLYKASKKYSHIIYGSDQIWAPNVYNPVYFGEYVREDVIKLSYAASIGLNDIPTELVQTYKQYLSKFDKISVRESKGAELLKNKCGIDSSVVLDPTLMINVKTYLGISKKVKEVSGAYIFCYFLNKNHYYRKTVEEYAQKLGLKVVGISSCDEDKSWMTFLNNVGPREFLSLINNAQVVFTDSYHGSIFSLLFHKKFYIFERFKQDDIICQNSRIEQLKMVFDLDDKILNAENLEIIDDSYNYEKFEEILQMKRHESISFLLEALDK